MASWRSLLCIVPLGLACVSCSSDVEKLKREHLQRGDRFVKENNADAAIIEYRNAVQKDPRFTEAYRKLSAAYLSRGEGLNALRAAATAADLAPDDADVQIEAGRLLLLAGRYTDAKARAEKVLARDAANIQGRLLLGNSTLRLKDFDSAIQEFQEAIRLDPSQTDAYMRLGAIKASRGEREAAEQSFRRAIEQDPKSAMARLALAQFYWSISRPQDAERLMKEALTLDPSDQRANLALSVFYQYTGRGADAEQYLKTAAAAKPNLTIKMSLADYYISQKREPEAVALLREIAPDSQVGVFAKMRLAAIARQAGHQDEAMGLIDDALATNPRNPIALVAKSDLLRQQHKLDEALTAADAAAASNPSSAEAQFARGKALVAKGSSEKAVEAFNEVLKLNPRAVAAQVELARLQLRAGSTDSSVAMASQITKADPTNLDARLTLARGLAAQREFARAQSVLNETLRAAPGNAAIHAQIGSLLAAKSDAAGARGSFTRALELNPLQLEAIGGLTALDLAARRQPEAVSRLDALLAREPKNPGLLLIAGQAFAATKDFTRAEALLVRAIQADPGAMPAYSMLGRIYLAQNRLDAARGQFERLATAGGKPVAALTFIGMIDQAQERTADARKAFEQVLQVDAEAAVASNNLAWIFADTGGNLDRALQLAQNAAAALPRQPEVHDTLGWVYFKKDQLPQAIAELKRSVELDPASATSRYHLGLAYQKNGDREQARQALQMYLKLDANSPRSAEVRRRLDSFGG